MGHFTTIVPYTNREPFAIFDTKTSNIYDFLRNWTNSFKFDVFRKDILLRDTFFTISIIEYNSQFKLSGSLTPNASTKLSEVWQKRLLRQ